MQPHVHFADLVEQEGAAVRRLEFTEAAGDGAAEGAPLMAEQLAFQQVLGDGGAVQRDEGAGGAAGAAVDVAGQHLLAAAALAGDQDACLGAGDLLGAADRGQHGRVPRDDGVALARGGFQDRGDEFGVWREREELAGAGGDGFGGHLRIGVEAAGDNGDGDPLGCEGADQSADVVRQLDQQQIDLGVDAEPGQGRAVVVCLLQFRAARGGDAGRLAQLASEGADDEDLHGLGRPSRP